MSENGNQIYYIGEIILDDTVENVTYICDPPCKPRPMMGRSWWKGYGYNNACSCAFRAKAREAIKQELRLKLIKKLKKA